MLRTEEIRNQLRALPILRPPRQLTVELQVVASREQARRLREVTLSWLDRALDRLRPVVDNLMRPLAIPFAGGLASAVFLFGSLVPNLGTSRQQIENIENDVATPIYQEAGVQTVSDFGGRGKCADDTLVELSIDSQGRVVDYTVPQGRMTSEMGNLILFTTYIPAKMFGQPTQGKVMFRRSRIVVKG